MTKNMTVSDVVALLLFAVPPTDRALAGWGIGDTPARTLAELATGRPRKDRLEWLLDLIEQGATS